MRVPPRPEFRILPQVFVPDIVTANEPNPSVHNHVLAVIAEVQPPSVAPAADGAESRHANAPLLPFPDDGRAHRRTAETVQKKTHLDSFRGLGGQRLQKPEPQSILPHDVELHENKPLRPGDFGKDRSKRGFSIHQQIEPVSLQKFLPGHRRQIARPGGLNVRAAHLKAGEPRLNVLNLPPMLAQLPLHRLRVRVKPPAAKKPVKRQAQPWKGNQSNHPGDGSLGRPNGEQRMRGTQDCNQFHHEKNG